MRAQKLREEAAEKKRDEHFSTIQPMFMTKQEWRVKEKANTPALMASDDDIDLSDDDESPLIKDGSLTPTGIDINMVFTLPTEFRGTKEEVAQMCLGPKEAMFKKLEESSQHMKLLHSRSHRWKTDLQDAHRRWRCHQLNVILRLQEVWVGGRRAHENQPNA
jgi:hypothetical protein